MNKSLLILPVFNEENHIEEVLAQVRLKTTIDILVVDDGSTDKTLEILQQAKLSLLIRHQTNLGYGQALIDGFDFAVKNDYQEIVTMDCDFQHEPDYIPVFLKEIKDFDIVSGSRYLHNSPRVDSPPEDRLEVNRLITQLIHQQTGYHLTDSFCGFKGYKVEAIKRLNLTEPGYGMPLQLWIQASRAGLRVKEIAVPLIYHPWHRDFKGCFRLKEERLAYYLEVIKREEKGSRV